MDRRDFVRKAGWTPAVFGAFSQLDLQEHWPAPPIDAQDEKGWRRLSKWWPRSRHPFNKSNLLNMNHATRGQPSRAVIKFYEKQAAHLLRGVQGSDFTIQYNKEALRSSMAALTQLPESNLAILRNATEALATAIHGIHLDKGDEVIIGRYDYPTMRQAWFARQKKEGILLREVDVTRAKNVNDAVDLYAAVLTPRTRAIHITDVVHSWGGQVPTKQILERMPGHVKYRIVDAAQSLGQRSNDLSGWVVTHIGACLQKWMLSPKSVGLLFVEDTHISSTEVLFGRPERLQDDISKFEISGSNDDWGYFAAIAAQEELQHLGWVLIQDRLLYLADRMRSGVTTSSNVRLLSPTSDAFKTAIVTVAHKTLDRKALHSVLAARGIASGLMNHGDIQGVRLSPGLMTSMEEVDHVVEVLRSLKS